MLYLHRIRRGSGGHGVMEDERDFFYSYRLPRDLHAALVDMAHREERSLNQQLIYLLRQAVRRDAERQKRQAPQ